MAFQGKDHDTNGTVTFVCTELNSSENLDDLDLITISIAEIDDLDFPSILTHSDFRIRVNRSRLIQESTYFRALLHGKFCETAQDCVTIFWNRESFLSVLRFIFQGQLEIISDNVVSLYEAALYFGVETLILKFKDWLDEITSSKGLQSPRISLDALIHLWKFGFEHAYDSIIEACTSYLARNFMWALSFNSFNCVPHELLCSCISHPDLTVHSEKDLCNAIIVWFIAQVSKPERWSDVETHVIRVNLLPLWFTAGKRSCQFFSTLADKATDSILSLARDPSAGLTNMFRQDDLSLLKFRLTRFTEKVDISGCPQIALELLLRSAFPSGSTSSMVIELIEKYAKTMRMHNYLTPGIQKQMLSFIAVQEVDISNCPNLPLGFALYIFVRLFPFLRSLKAAHSLKINTPDLGYFFKKFNQLANVDLTLDISPVVLAEVSVTSSSQIPAPPVSITLDEYSNYYTDKFIARTSFLKSGITKLNLEGRTDMNDSDLHSIIDMCANLDYINVRGCTSLTDDGLSLMIMKCKCLNSIEACGTSFGRLSAYELCSSISNGRRLQMLHLGGCNRVDGKILYEIMSGAGHLRSLCLSKIQLVDDALYGFDGSSLQMLDVSDTKVSRSSLYRVICRNLDLKLLKIRGCAQLAREQIGMPSLQLEEIELGWGFSFLSLEAVKPAIRTLRSITIGLGASLGPDGLKLIPTICPLLETVILYFQVISDSAVSELIKTLRHLRSLALCYCNGDISSLSFKFKMPNLMKLKLERVTPWMTTKDLMIIAESCMNLIALCLTGCRLLKSESQHIISKSWPGLTYLHLEDCGEITASGVGSLFNCCALEDLALRHSGPGIPRNFIIDATSKLPMLRKISLDTCDATDGDYDLPSFHDRHFLTILKIARCKRGTVYEGEHKEMMVLVWNNKTLTRTVVKERF